MTAAAPIVLPVHRVQLVRAGSLHDQRVLLALQHPRRLGEGGDEGRVPVRHLPVGSGDDVIDPKNGQQDTIDGGSGQDKVTFDAGLDEVENCEQIRS